jgi:hypothetical protein
LPMGGDMLRFSLISQPDSVNAWTAREGRPEHGAGPLEGMFKNGFDRKFMTIENYGLAEQFAPVGYDLTVPLVLTLNVGEDGATAGTLNFSTLMGAEQAFLVFTNKTLNDSDPETDTSYLFQHLGRYDPYFRPLNMVRLRNLVPGKQYKLRLSMISEFMDVEMQVVSVGKNARLRHTKKRKVPKGHSIMEEKFIALNHQAEFGLLMNEEVNVRVFGVEVLPEQ